jgi:transcriptional regulator with XRE-family HTH domain
LHWSRSGTNDVPQAAEEGAEGMKRTRSAKHLISARELLGWSKEAVAEKLGRTATSVWENERGRGSLENADRLVALYEAHGVEFLPDGQVRIKTDGAK